MMMKKRTQQGFVAFAVGLSCLAVIAALIHFGGEFPRILPAFRQRFWHFLALFLFLCLPYSLWRHRGHRLQLTHVAATYVLSVLLLFAEAALCPHLFRAGLSVAVPCTLALGSLYGGILILSIRLWRLREYAVPTAFLLFLATGIVDLMHANRFHGNIHEIVSWTV